MHAGGPRARTRAADGCPVEHTIACVQVDPAHARVLLTDAPLNSTANRAKAVEVLFEEVGVDGLCLQPSPVLSLYSQGAQSLCQIFVPITASLSSTPWQYARL
jgi:actin-related protein